MKHWLAVVLAVALVGCDVAASQPEAITARTDLIQWIELQGYDAGASPLKEILEDGRLEFVEYEQRAEGFVQCMAEAGLPNTTVAYEADPTGWGGGFAITVSRPSGTSDEVAEATQVACERDSFFDPIARAWAVLNGPTPAQRKAITEAAARCVNESGWEGTYDSLAEQAAADPDLRESLLECSDTAARALRESIDG